MNNFRVEEDYYWLEEITAAPTAEPTAEPNDSNYHYDYIAMASCFGMIALIPLVAYIRSNYCGIPEEGYTLMYNDGGAFAS